MKPNCEWGRHPHLDEKELNLWVQATRLVEMLPDDPEGKLRCHELSRAIGQILNLPVQDGEYGIGCEHSWLWTPMGNILDVHSICRLPQVQLVHTHYPTAEQGRLYRGGPPRTDINQFTVDNLVSLMNISF